MPESALSTHGGADGGAVCTQPPPHWQQAAPAPVAFQLPLLRFQPLPACPSGVHQPFVLYWRQVLAAVTVCGCRPRVPRIFLESFQLGWDVHVDTIGADVTLPPPHAQQPEVPPAPVAFQLP